MGKQEFLAELQNKLYGLPQEDLDEHLSFYQEMIDDRMEDGRTEEEAVAELGSVDEVASQILSEIPLSRIVKKKVKSGRTMKIWEIILLILGSPIWISLLIAAFAILLSLYIVLWAFLICVYAVDLSLVAAAVACIPGAVIALARGNGAAAGLIFGGGLVCAGLAILLFFGCIGLTRSVIKLSKKILIGIKSLFIKKGGRKS